MNKLLIGIIVIALAVGGYYAYTMNNGDVDATPTPTTLASATPTASVSPSLSASTTPGVSVGVSVGVGTVKSFTVTASNFKFDPKEIKVKQGDTVKITLKSSGMPHDWNVDGITGAKTNILQSGQEQTIEFKADKKGTFEYYCSVGQHRANGMVGKLIVE